MLTVTESAVEQLKEILLANTDDQEIGLRLLMEPPGQFGLVLDKESPADNVVEHEGRKVLMVGTELGELLQEATLDIQSSPDGPKLVIN